MKAKQRLASGVLAASLLLSVALPAMPLRVQAAPAAGMQLYVAPDGSDSASGTIDAPLKTLEGARDKIRAIKAESGLPEGGITVNLRQGDYKYLESSFTLEAQDSGAEGSPIVYQAYPGETVTLSGNVEASGADFEPVTDEAVLARLPESVRDKVLVYDVTGNLGISEFAPLPKNGFGWPDQPAALNITVDGEAQTLARYPNDGFVKIDKSYSTGFIPRNHMPNPDGSCPECTKANGGERIPCKIGEDNWIDQPSGVWGSRALADKYELWSQENDIWTFGYFCWDWADDNIAVKSLEKDGDMLKITGQQPSRYGVNSGMKFEDPEQRFLLKLGSTPLLLETGTFDLAFTSRHAGSLKAYALAMDGKRISELPLQIRGSRVMLHLDTAAIPNGPALYFELNAN